ncbi:hypothetical protein PFISCL1PPCAC_8143, partial [Pristionchus fissidentatus]
DSVILEINQLHLLTNLLESSLGAERRQIGTNVSVALVGDLLEINIVSELHVLGVNAENLQSSDRIGDSDIDFTIEAT